MIGISFIGAGLGCIVGGCPQQQTGDPSEDQSVSSEQSVAIEAAINSIESLTGSLNTTQSATASDAQSSRTVSTCPEATFSADNTTGLSLVLSLDFGDGCDVLGSAGYSCSGSLSGTFSQTAQTFDAEFGGLTCNGRSLEGSLSFSYDIAASNVDVEGNWDLSYTDAAWSVATVGVGTASYDTEAATTTFSTFEGEATSNSETYGVTLVNIVTSPANNGNFVPQAGVLTLTGEKVDSIAITFSSASPLTGDVMVSVNGGPSFEYNLFDD